MAAEVRARQAKLRPPRLERLNEKAYWIDLEIFQRANLAWCILYLCEPLRSEQPKKTAFQRAKCNSNAKANLNYEILIFGRNRFNSHAVFMILIDY
jgi:hypothetical protein